MRTMKMQKQQGFTLIELVVVIVILGILAAVALPKFIDLRTDASLAATQGVAGAVSSAFAINYGAYLASNGTKGSAISGASVTGSAAVSSVMGALPTGYTASSATVACGTGGLTQPVTISGANSQTASATLVCTG